MASFKYRGESGVSLVDLMISVLIMTFVSTAMFGLLAGTGFIGQKVMNKLDSLNSARDVLEKIGRDVRMGRALGDVVGVEVQLQPAQGGNPAIMGVQGTDSFPSALNPLYGSGQTPPGGWAWGGPPYVLNATTLIVQVPIFDSNGFPKAIPAGFGAPAATSAQDDVETHIYRVIADPDTTNHPGEYILQISKVAGKDPAPSDTAAPRTLLTGIVGPFDIANNLQVFQYLDKTDGTGTAVNTIADPALMANYTGMIINVEVLRKAEGKTTPQALAVRTEVSLRNNTTSTTTN